MGGLPTQKTVYAFTYVPTAPTVMYAALREGIYFSKNAGKQWSLLSNSPKGVVALANHPKDPKKIFAGTGQGNIYLSENGGATWKLQNKK